MAADFDWDNFSEESLEKLLAYDDNGTVDVNISQMAGARSKTSPFNGSEDEGGDFDLPDFLAMGSSMDAGDIPLAVANGGFRNDASFMPVHLSDDPYLFGFSPMGDSQAASTLSPASSTVTVTGGRRHSSRSSDEGISLSPAATDLGMTNTPGSIIVEEEDHLPDASLLGITTDSGFIVSPAGHSNDIEMYPDTIEIQKAVFGDARYVPSVIEDDEDDGPKPDVMLLNARLVPDGMSTGEEITVGDGKCYVCKEKAGKHSYYGGHVCPSCRAFFRRAVQSKYYEIFFCTKGETCEINLKTRRSCQFCRFKKCLESGMRVAWVLPDGERNRRFNKLAKVSYRNRLADSPSADDALVEMEKRQQSQTIVPVHRSPPAGAASLLTSSDMAIITQTHAIATNNKCKSFEEYVAAHPAFLKDLANLSYFGGTMNYEVYRTFNRMYDKFTSELFLSLDDFKQLPLSDQRQLLLVNGQMINRFKNSLSIQEENSCLSNGIEVYTKSGRFPFMNDITQRLSALNLDSKKPTLDYEQLFVSPWAATYDEERRHRDLMRKMKAWPRDTPTSPQDDLQVTLMFLILAFSPNYVQLARRDIVEQNQLKYVLLLQKYLKFKYGPAVAASKLANGLMLISYAKEADQIQQQRLPV